MAASGALAASAAQAQQVCCVAGPPPQQVCCVSAQAQAGLRGYADTPTPPYASDAAYGSGYAPPEYGPRPLDGLRGYVGVEYGEARIEGGAASPDPRVQTWTGEGAVVGGFGALNYQGDMKIADYRNLHEGGAGDGTAYSPTGHIYERNAYGLIGGWAGWSHTKGADLFGIGAEGQAYFGSATLYGSVGYGHVNSTLDQDLVTGRLEGRYFVTENFMLNAYAGLVRASASGADTTVRTVGFGAEYQPDVVPFSIHAGYSHADASHSTAESDTIRVGLRWNFGGGTLAERDRSGPTLDNVTDLFMSN